MPAPTLLDVKTAYTMASFAIRSAKRYPAEDFRRSRVILTDATQLGDITWKELYNWSPDMWWDSVE